MPAKDLTPVIAYVTPEVKAKLAALAGAADRTVSQEAHRALREYVEGASEEVGPA